MVRTARVLPAGTAGERGWKVVDVTDPDREIEVSRHDTEQAAIKAAREFEGSPEYGRHDQEGEGATAAAFTVRQVDAADAASDIEFEVYDTRTGESVGRFGSEQQARAAAAQRNGDTPAG
jgi:hypothetical protein